MTYLVGDEPIAYIRMKETHVDAPRNKHIFSYGKTG